MFILQEAQEESMNDSGTEFEIPSRFDETVGAFYWRDLRVAVHVYLSYLPAD